MIWIQHDFLKNFTKSVSSGDTDLTLSLFRSELSDLIVYKTEEIFSLFDKLEIKYKPSQSDEEILDKILDNMADNDKFVRGLSFLIAENNDVIKKNKKKSWVSILNAITKGLKKINQVFSDNPKKKMLFHDETLEMISLKADKLGNRERKIIKKDNTVLWVIGIAVVGIGAYLIYEYFKYKKAKELEMQSGMMNMGNVGNMELGGQATAGNVSGAQAGVQQTNVGDIKPDNLDPSFNVGSDVLIPAQNVPNQNPSTTVVVNTGASNPSAVPPQQFQKPSGQNNLM